MSKICLLHLYSIAILLFSTSIFGSEISFCDRTPFRKLCNMIVGPKFESRESGIKESINQAREALGHFLVMARTMFDSQARGWTDCLELYEDARRHLNLSTSHTNPTRFQKWLTEALVKHKACQNGFNDSNLSSHLKHLVLVLQNFSKTLVGLLTQNKPSADKILTADEHRLIQIADVGAPKANLVVAQDGSGAFKTVNEAVQAAKQQRTGTDRFVIYVKAGVYNENVNIDSTMPNLTLIGDGIDVTVITNDKNTDEGYSTFDTATFQVWGAGFLAIGITFENVAGPGKQQAIALLSASEQSVFYKCSFKGYQDTLCLLRNRQFYRECDIYGTIDFIFGDAAAVLQKCNIYVQNPAHGQQNTITAQGRTDPNAPTGFVIHNSRVTGTADLIGTNGSVSTFLGRPWKDYARVVFAMCFLDGLIDPRGWMPFPGSSAFDRLYFAEYKNNGKGADASGRVKWPGYHVLTSDEEAEQYSVGKFLDGSSWIPTTGVPFNSRLF
ncbi:pectinesterase-like [Cynara cardunculus var. scolymus]|nr:pectinesterase-like [Cynara cardunculus var. scolymus]